MKPDVGRRVEVMGNTITRVIPDLFDARGMEERKDEILCVGLPVGALGWQHPHHKPQRRGAVDYVINVFEVGFIGLRGVAVDDKPYPILWTKGDLHRLCSTIHKKGTPR